ncbi:MAG: hypothetical protein J7574_12530 [Flavobacterium sp.]|uniref:hypothetical protein n=1 Tax=Flavobacterium sp. TaxID=239 RepID=UPI001B190714|nr:hypothetical protein [Flavobacterium sp.]MBO9584978.1 hypothetical protein [Flavobacterium sp.]
MLKVEKLIEFGFVEISHDLGNYYAKSKLCLVPQVGVWVVASNFGEIASGVERRIPYIVNELDLRNYIRWCGLNDVEFLGS